MNGILLRGSAGHQFCSFAFIEILDIRAVMGLSLPVYCTCDIGVLSSIYSMLSLILFFFFAHNSHVLMKDFNFFLDLF